MPGKGWFLFLRLYSPKESFFRPDLAAGGRLTL
jgi:hypothetical protein